MGVEIAETMLPSGHKVLSIELSGELEIERGRAVIAELRPSRLPMCFIIRDDFRVSLSARHVLFEANGIGQGRPVAIVMKSPLVRAMMSFLFRAMAIRSGTTGEAPVFMTEAEAAAWFETQLKAAA